MSEFDKENTFDSFNKSEAVEAFEDFEMSLDDIEASSETVEVFDEIESVMAAVEAVEEVEAVREDETDEEAYVFETTEETDKAVEFFGVDEKANRSENSFETDEAIDQPEETDQDAEEFEEAEEPVEEAEELDETEEPVQDAEELDETEEPVEDAEELEEAEEPVEDAEELDETEEPVEDAEELDETEEPVEGAEELDETEEPVEDAEELDETEEAVEDEDKSEIDIMSTVMALEACADNQDDSANVLDKDEFSSEDLEIVDDESTETENNNEKSEFADEYDEDDYLDYDDHPRPKKTVSGKAALITMLVTGIVTICLIVGAFWMGLTVNKDIGITVASYSDRFNACDTNSFYLAQLMGASFVSMSDTECTLSNEEINALKKGNTVTKFNNMMNLKADTRFGKIVSMDISFNPELDEQKEPGITCMVLLGNAMSGLKDNIDTSDKAFLEAYNAIVNYSSPAPKKGDRVYVYHSDGISFYTDYSKMEGPNKYSDLQVHVENQDPKYIDTEKLDFSWLPFDFSSDKKTDDAAVSPSDK